MEDSDADLVGRYRRTKEVACFERLVQRHRARLLRLVLGVLGPELQADAEDVVQLVFVRIHERLDAFHGGSLFATWAHRVAYNLALDFKRTQLRRQRLLREQPADPDRRDPTIERELGVSEQASAIRNALGEVPDPYQTVLRLHYWLDLSVIEIAETLGVSAGTVKSYLHRGRSRLQRVLTDRGLVP